MNFSWKQKDYHPSLLLRGVQIFLLILIIIGIGLLCTQNIWVPRVVDYFLYSEMVPSSNLIGNVSTSTFKYINSEYGFTFSLPASWSGHSVITASWTGEMLDTANNQTITGPEILIRHPLWTAETPRQDIPIMIFTPDQWNLIQQEKLSLGAAPIGPSELGRNDKYIFGLPARYNFAFSVGFEEVMKILESNPLQPM